MWIGSPRKTIAITFTVDPQWELLTVSYRLVKVCSCIYLIVSCNCGWWKANFVESFYWCPVTKKSRVKRRWSQHSRIYVLHIEILLDFYICTVHTTATYLYSYTFETRFFKADTAVILFGILLTQQPSKECRYSEIPVSESALYIAWPHLWILGCKLFNKAGQGLQSEMILPSLSPPSRPLLCSSSILDRLFKACLLFSFVLVERPDLGHSHKYKFA